MAEYSDILPHLLLMKKHLTIDRVTFDQTRKAVVICEAYVSLHVDGSSSITSADEAILIEQMTILVYAGLIEVRRSDDLPFDLGASLRLIQDFRINLVMRRHDMTILEGTGFNAASAFV